MAITPVISLITLGVSDLERATEFYRALGWPLSSSSVPGDVSFFRTAGGLLAVWGKKDLAEDCGLPESGDNFGNATCAINLADRDAVDSAFAEVAAAGGRVLKAPQATDWGGYSGYFADPDGHVWEIAHNPGWPLGVDGMPVLPE
jgi:uncharacterized protein